MVRRLAVSALATVCLLTCTGCEPICSGPLGAYCPDGVQQKPLNRPTLAKLDGGFKIASRHLPLTAVRRGGTLDFEADYEVPDGDALYYEWDLDGHGGYERAGYGKTAHVTYGMPGLIRVRVRVSDFPSLPGAPGVVEEARKLERTVEVFTATPGGARAPIADFGISPILPGLQEPVTLDARDSRDPDGHGINSYEWDLDGDGSFETRGGSPLHRSFAEPGPRRIGLRVWDGFLRDVVYSNVDVLPFQTTLGPSSPVGPTRFLSPPWRTRTSFGPRGADAIALANVRGGAACLRIRASGETGTLEVLGGTGAGARIRATASFRFRLERDGSATVLGHLRARTARKRPLPTRCRRLTRR
jgi:hypothetical protein